MRFLEHGCYTLFEGAIDLLCHSILLWPIAHGVLPFNAMLIAELSKRIAHVFAFFVVAQNAYLSLCAVLSPSFVLLKHRKCLILGGHGLNSIEVAVVIHIDDPVTHSRGCAHHRTMNIGMNKL